VTQLYVSVDAATQESLKQIDRPLFKDFWTRFIDSLKALSTKVLILCLLFTFSFEFLLIFKLNRVKEQFIV